MTDAQAASALVDPFVRQRLPPSELWPRMDWSGVPELAYPPQINCASELLDRWIAEGEGDRVAFHHASGAWTYRRVFETANRIAISGNASAWPSRTIGSSRFARATSIA